MVGLASESRNPNFPAYIIQSAVPSRNSVSGWPAENDFANSPWERGMLCFTWPAFFYKLPVLEAIGAFVALGILHLCGIRCSVFHIHTFIWLLCWNSFGHLGRRFDVISCLVEVWLLKTICVPQQPFVYLFRGHQDRADRRRRLSLRWWNCLSWGLAELILGN